MPNNAVVKETVVYSGNALDEFLLEPETPPTLLIDWRRSRHKCLTESGPQRAEPRKPLLELVRPPRQKAVAPPTRRQSKDWRLRLQDLLEARFVQDTGPGTIAAIIGCAIAVFYALLQ